MAQASDRLRKKFNFGKHSVSVKSDGVSDQISDGIAEAEKVITDAGGTINKEFITPPTELPNSTGQYYNDFWDAVQFLCDEWNYSFNDSIE